MTWLKITSAKQACKGAQVRPVFRLQEVSPLVIKERRIVTGKGNTVFFTDGSTLLVSELKCHYEVWVD